MAVPSSETLAKGYSFSGTSTGIDGIGSEAVAGKAREIYNIAGQKVNAMSKDGLYIVNGKKIVVRK